MAKIVWRKRAARQLEEIFSFLVDRSPAAAANYASELYNACIKFG